MRLGSRRRIVQEARRELVPPSGRQQLRIDLVAGLEALRATRVEPAAGRHLGRVGQLAAQELALAPTAGRRDRHRRHQRLRVRVLGALDDVLRSAELDHSAQVHHRDPVAQRPRQAEVVGDEQQRQLALLLKIQQNPQDLRLHRHVEHRDRLVADQAVRLEHQRRRDRHPLALAARELMRVPLAEALRVEPDILERLLDLGRALGLGHALDDERLGDDRPHPLARIQCLVRVLEDHLQAPAEFVVAALAVLRVSRRARRSPGRRLDQAEHRPGERRLAATRLADDARAPHPCATRARRRRRRAPSRASTRNSTARSRTSTRAADSALPAHPVAPASRPPRGPARATPSHGAK